MRRERAATPDDVGAARRLAAALGRAGEREEAARAWQDVLAGSPRDGEAEERLRGLGCELFLRERLATHEVFENGRDGASLLRIAPYPRLFVAREPVTYEQFRRFLEATVRTSARPASERERQAARWLSPRSPLRGSVLTGWAIRGAAGDFYVLDATWFGAVEYARWAGGRLLVGDEWRVFARRSDQGVLALDRPEGEWLADPETGPIDVTEGVLDGAPRFETTGSRPISPPGSRRFPAEGAPSVFFRYARDSWFEGAG